MDDELAPGTELELAADTALVELFPGTALLFGEPPAGVEVAPFRLVSQEDRSSLSAAIAATTSVLNVGGQLASGLAQAEGLVRLAPQTLQALKAGATPVQSAGYNIGVLAGENGKFAAQVRWLPAEGVQAAQLAANLGPAMAMVAIQVQLNEIAGLVRENLALTEAVLKTVRHEQWAELTGLEQAISKALDEASAVGHVTPLLWENIAGYEAGLRKQRDLYRRHVEAHADELATRKDHKDRRQFIEKNGEALVLDVHCLILAHKSWFEYQALRAGRARLGAQDDPNEAKLLQAIIDNARTEYHEVVDELAAVLEPLNRELWIMTELPGKKTIPFTGGRKSAGEVAAMAKQMLDAIEQLSDSIRPRPAPLERPASVFGPEPEQLDKDLGILRWHLNHGEELDALATAIDLAGGNALRALPGGHRVSSSDVLIAITQERVLAADLSDFRNQGFVQRSIPNDDIRYMRFRDDSDAERVEVDVITKHENLTWRFAKGSDADESVRALGAHLAERMEIPQSEREALQDALPAGSQKPLELNP